MDAWLEADLVDLCVLGPPMAYHRAMPEKHRVAEEIRAGYGKDPEEAEARHKQEIEQFLRGSDPAKGDEDKADDKPSSSR